jgi:hypothetical protein
MRKLFLIATTLCLLIFSCTNNKNKTTQTVPAFKQSPLDSAYATIRPAIQIFTIDNTKTITIKAAHGTEILIPAGCLANANGDKVENAQLEVVEAFTLPEFITSGLATISNGQLLISNGMAYINAKAGNENLQLKEGAALIVSMPTMSDARGFQLFTGDGSNWTVDSSMSATDYMMPLPLDLLYPEGHNTFWYCIEEGSHHHILDTNIVDILNSKYENTVIATEEFKSRYGSIMSMMMDMSFFVNRDHYFDDTNCGDQHFNYAIWKVYLDHPNRPLGESDSIAKKTFIDYYKTNKEKIAAFYEEVNVHKRTYYDNWTDTNYYFDLRNTTAEDYFLSTLKLFPAAKPGPLKLINDHGVNLDAADAWEQLVAKGVNDNEITETLSYHLIRRDKIRNLKRIKDAITNTHKLAELYESTIFSVKKLGWINCDRFFDDPTAAKAEMYVSNTLKNKPDVVDYSLVIPELNVRLNAFKDNNGRYTFTQNKGPYTKLPIGIDAVITAVSLHEDSLYFGHQKIKITDGLSVNLSMKHIDTKDLKDSLQMALN